MVLYCSSCCEYSTGDDYNNNNNNGGGNYGGIYPLVPDGLWSTWRSDSLIVLIFGVVAHYACIHLQNENIDHMEWKKFKKKKNV